MPRLRWVFLCAAATLLLAITATSFLLEMRRVERLTATLDRRMDELIRITRQTQILEERIRYYRTPEGVGRLAREEFNLFLPWEKVYRIEVVSADPLRKR
ncbi:conserved hypothetical protein [Aminomonas paucivorans DSM 12260]|uniref:Septum formation initiator n=1 Tax=Aminomonas paucivorans DSM 12260 TaxID=584708 RepID=E3CX14_9BACT|nr:hypothetical protein [Aminomonas paucivorans]EFQ23464.1 conserved hypothetical protein [Aminomonas paucivorans DSM 12260]